MSLDVMDLREFYTSPLGLTARRLLRLVLKRLWPSVRGETILSLGYATPLLRPWLGEARRLMALMSETQGVVYWPHEGPNVTALVSFDHLPLPDETVDRVVLMHALEGTESPDQFMREVWRVMKGQGRLLMIVPNRAGCWTHSDKTPFGQGRPFSSVQMRALLHDQGFLVERISTALHILPNASRFCLAIATLWERYAGWLFPMFGGVLVVEASKQMYAPLISKATAQKRRRVLVPLSLPTRPLPAGRN